MPYLAFDLDALEKAPQLARAAGIAEDTAIAGLLRMWRECWRRKTDQVSVVDMCGFFGSDISQALINFGFLVLVGVGRFHVKGASRYLRIANAQRAGGLAAKGNLKRGTKRGPGCLPAGSRVEPELEPGVTPGYTSGYTSGCVPGLTASSEQRSKEEVVAQAATTPPETDGSSDTGGPAAPSPELKLVGDGAKRPRRKSKQEVFASWFEAERKEVLGDGWRPDHEVPVPALNTRLEWVKEASEDVVSEAARLYLSDEKRRRQHPPCSLNFFIADKAAYLSMAEDRLAAEVWQ